MDSSSSDPSAVDSTRKLLQDLRLGRAYRLGMHMDSMEMDLALEIPDTPERLTMPQAEEDFSGNVPREIPYSNRRNIRSSNGINAESLFRKGRIASSISNPSDSKIPHPTRLRTARRRTTESSNVSHSTDSLSSGIKGITGISAEDEASELASNGNGITLMDSSSKHPRSLSLDKGKGISLSNDRSNKIELNQISVRPKNSGQRKLVRNGLISPVNIAKSSTVRGNDQDRNDRSFQPSDQHPRHVYGVDSPDDESVIDLGSNGRRPFREKRKPRLNGSHLGESSSSRNLERSIIDVDELPSPVLRNRPGFDSDAKAQQVISDEIYARQLQEEFFNESPFFDEVDSSVAMALQQEENNVRSSLIRGRSQSQRRDPSAAHLNRQYPRRPSQISRSNSTNPPRVTSSARMAQLRRNLRRGMDLETRLNFLEALEVAFSIGNDPRGGVLHLHRDFNENDYEMLLALDDENHRHVGASLQQISSLPESVIQTDNVEEACAICLETPSVGDTVRHLPCLHKFHKDCIDEWLRRKTTCPICKSGIT